MVITTTASAYTCGDFNLDGSIKTAAASWPYNTGDVQWNTFNFKFGTVVWQSAYPASGTSLWPSHWFLTSTCQTLNKYSGDTGVGGCPNFGATGYDEIDAIECFGGSCNMNLYHNGTSQNCFIPAPNWDTALHTWMMIWTSTSLTMSRDGTQICSFSANIPQQNMFMLIQTQTGGIAGTPVNAQLPATLTTKFVKVCTTTDGTCSTVAPSSGTVTFFDNFAVNSIPNDNTGCPSDCRIIPWQTGSDIWNGGSLPVYTSVTCTGLAANGTTNDGPAIQTCINALSSNQAAFIPSGTYLVNSTVRLKSNAVLRGAGSSTQINLGASGTLTTQNFSFSGNLNPGTSFNTLPSVFNFSGTPQKGDTTITCSTGCASVGVGTWIKIFGNDDPTLVNGTGTDGACQWCGDNTGRYLQQQIVQVTAINGSVFTLSKPLYYKPFTSVVGSEPAGAHYNIISFPTQKAGYEYFHVTATSDIGAAQIILMQGCLFCWVKGVETQNAGSSSGSAHIEWDESYGGEVRDSYVHDGRSSASGANYGIYFQFINSDHKVENNISRHNRHGLIFQGGGSGIAWLYNYLDDNYTDDLTYLGSARTSHGAHTYMVLLEGNIMSHLTADDFWGTTSHFVNFRNWFWGDETGTGVPSFPPANGYDAVDLFTGQEYYSFVGNVLGHLNLHTTWSAATLSGNNAFGTRANPVVYSADGVLGSAASSSATILRHGNFDYKTNGVAFWDGGTNHTLQTSIYYSSQPAFLSQVSKPWPLLGPEGNPTINTNPAQDCYNNGPAIGQAFDAQICFAAQAGTPAVSLSQSSVNCGSSATGIQAVCTAVTLTNSGTAILTISSITLGGTNPADFSDSTTCGATLAAQTSCTITPTFTPSATGARSGSISITDSAVGSPHVISLTGTGTSSGSPIATLSVSSITYGTQNVNTSSLAVAVIFSNTGTAVLGITSISLTGTNPTDFSQANNCPIGSNLGTSSSCTINVTFTPLASGSRVATLSIVDSAAGSPHTASLAGTGIQAVISGQINSGARMSGRVVLK